MPPPARHHPTLLLAIATSLTLLATGCGSRPGAESPQRHHAPQRLLPAGATPSTGTHRVVCRIRSAHGPVRLALDLPRGFVRGPADGYEPAAGGCTWHRPVTVRPKNDDPQASPEEPYSSNVVLSVQPASADASVAHEYDEAEPDTSTESEGDDSILHLRREQDVPAFGRTRGDRLSYLCFCDGQNVLSRFAQADGILLTWGADSPQQRETDRWLDAILASAGTDPRS